MAAAQQVNKAEHKQNQGWHLIRLLSLELEAFALGRSFGERQGLTVFASDTTWAV